MERKPYPSDVTAEQWRLIEPSIPPGKWGGRPRAHDMREVVNAILYVVRTGCSWRPAAAGRTISRRGRPCIVISGTSNVMERGNGFMIASVRRFAKRPAKSPRPASASSTASRSRRLKKGGARGYDAGKKIKGRKRHVIVDTLGLIVVLVVHPANLQDRDGGRLVVQRLGTRFRRLRRIFADGGYAGRFVDWVRGWHGRFVEIVERHAVGRFVVLPKRWIVERTFAWLGKYR